jgi:hypothetical protein
VSGYGEKLMIKQQRVAYWEKYGKIPEKKKLLLEVKND